MSGPTRTNIYKTYIRPNVEVLEVVSVLPDIDSDDGGEGQQRVLIRRRSNLETLCLGVQTLPIAQR